MRARGRAACASLAVMLVACSGADPARRAVADSSSSDRTRPGPTGSVAYQSNAEGNADLYVRAADGVTRRVTSDPGFDGFASWSPDGARIAFDSDRPGNGNREIYVTDAAGGPTKRLTDHPGFDFVPAWSPAGDWIAFVSTRDSDFDPVKGNVDAFRGEIYRIRPDGTGLERLTSDPAHDQAPVWTADGRAIAWCRDVGGEGDIWIMDGDGANPRPLVATSDFECTPRFSPDGQRLAWRSSRGDSAWIMIGRADGSGGSRLEVPFARAYEPAWSPDGAWICFTVEDEDGGLDVYAVAAGGGQPVLIAGGPGREQGCAWRPVPG